VDLAGKIYVGSPTKVAGLVAEAVIVVEVKYLAGSFAWGSLSTDASIRLL